MEIIVGLTIGAILIGTASFGIAFTLRSTSTNQNLGNASQLTQGLLNNAQTLAFSNWQNIYGLSKSSTNQYFLNASGTSYIAVKGQEGVIDNDVTNGLVGRWGLDEATGTVAYDSTGNNYNGTLTNSPTRATSTCKIANCMYFDGADDQISLGSGTQYDSGNFSVTLWMRPVQLNGTTANSNIFLGRETYLTSGFRAGVRGASSPTGRVDFWTTQSGGTLTLTSGSTYVSTTTNVFYHVAITYSSSTSQGNMYLNGVLVGSSTGGHIVPTGNTLALDGGIGGVTFLNAYMDDVRWYNRALSASEVKQLVNSQSFTRYFYVENVCRTNDSAGDISTTASPCPGGTADDPLTQKVTAITSWLVGAGLDQVSLGRYITRWGNFAIRQTDWAGNSGQEGPLSAPNDRYSSSTNIVSTSTLGSFQILNLSQQ
ncbi:LamG domain-containing protein [bacterium]|nr:MAG: LamG domain-containing protein [bacterium]